MSITLTAAGLAKINRFIEAAGEAAAAASANAASRLRAAVAEAAPSETEEAELLSRGLAVSTADVAGGIGGGFGEIGTPSGGRFIRNGAMVSLRTAIAADPIEVTRSPNRVVARTGSAIRINEVTGFSWETRRRGEQGPTFPFNHNYLMAMEHGGTWVVTPRPGTRALEPEPGVIAGMMLKTLQPRRMYSGTISLRRQQVKEEMGSIIEQRVRLVT